MPEEVFPVCSPSLMRRSGVASTRWLLRQTLIHDTTSVAVGVFPTWEKWLEFSGISAKNCERGLRINASAAVIQAAARGRGVALARGALVARDLDEGRLVRLFPTKRWPIPWSYFVVSTPAALKRRAVRTFHDWLVAAWSRS